MEDEKELFLRKFEEKLKNHLDKKTLSQLSNQHNLDEELTSKDYEQFRVETLPLTVGLYEKYCNFCQRLVNLKEDKKNAPKVNELLYKAHMNCNADGAISASVLTALIIVMIGLVILIGFQKMSIGMGIVLVGLFSYMIMQNMPKMFYKRNKTKASDQIIIAIFYIVAFMRFNSNFELAVSFAANYLNPPLSLDFKRILWELDNAKYPTIKSAFDDYLEDWRDDSLEFLEAIYLIESSLYESEDIRRISLLDKSLDIILQGNYEKMLHFAQELRGKVSTFNMLGVILPILGLIILPLAASFGNPMSVLEVVLLIYNIIVPLGIGYYGFLIIFNRPSSVNSIKMPTQLKEYKTLQKIPFKLSKKKTIYVSPKVPAIAIFSIMMFIGLLPMIFYYTGFDQNLNLIMENLMDPTSPFGYFQEFKEIDTEAGDTYIFGPYGTYPSLISLFIPLSFAFGIGYYLKYKYGQLVHLRDRTKNLEKQFPSATFQLGNRINEGLSAELAFGVVAETMKSTEAGAFFSKIDANIKFNGMSVEKSIFDEKKGAINEYPSELITSSMKILVRAIEKGPEITAKTLIDLSRYLSEIHMSNERMMDLLAESLSSMKGQASFLAPLIAGIVISIVSLVTMIMGKLSDALQSETLTGGGTGGLGAFTLGESIPTYLFQSVVGMYMVFLIAILVYMVVSLENGEDPINSKYQIGKKLISSMTKYSVVVLLGIILFTYLGTQVLGSIV